MVNYFFALLMLIIPSVMDVGPHLLDVLPRCGSFIQVLCYPIHCVALFYIVNHWTKIISHHALGAPHKKNKKLWLGGKHKHTWEFINAILFDLHSGGLHIEIWRVGSAIGMQTCTPFSWKRPATHTVLRPEGFLSVCPAGLCGKAVSWNVSRRFCPAKCELSFTDIRCWISLAAPCCC